MSFADALAKAAPPAKPLRVDEVLDALDADTATEVRAALADPAVKSRQLARAFDHIGHPVSETAVNTWRRRNVTDQ
jgi:hypothetical protein